MILAETLPSSAFTSDMLIVLLMICNAITALGTLGMWLVARRKPEPTQLQQPVVIRHEEDCVERKEYEERQAGEKKSRDAMREKIDKLGEQITRIEENSTHRKEQIISLEQKTEAIRECFNQFNISFAKFRGEISSLIKGEKE